MSKEKAVVLVDPESSGLFMKETISNFGAKIIALITINKNILVDMPLEQVPEKENWLAGIGYDCVIFDDDPDRIVKSLSESQYEIIAIIPASEYGVKYSDIIAEKMNLPGNDPTLTMSRRNKSLMKQVARQSGLKCANYKECYLVEDLIEFADLNGYPIVLKTPEGAGSHNVFICNNFDELIDKFNLIYSTPDCAGLQAKYVLAEEYIDGIEYVVNLFGNGTDVIVTDIWQYQKISNSYADNLYYNNIMESIDDPSFTELKDYAIKLSKAVGIKIGPVHAEIKLSSKGPVMIEIASRFGGWRFPIFLRDCSDFDPFEASLEVFINGKTSNKKTINFHQTAVVANCPNEKIGIITEIKGLTDITSLRSYHSHSLCCKEQKVIQPTVDLTGISLFVGLVGHNKEQLLKDAEYVHNAFKIVTHNEFAMSNN